MFIELIDVLRCTQPHEESWLVASALVTEGRHLMKGTLGCPVCHAEYPVREGMVDFTGGSAPDAAMLAAARPAPARHALGVWSPDDAMRLAALLDLSDDRGYVLLTGRWAAAARDLQSIVENQLLAVNPPAGVTGGLGLSVILAAGVLPIAAGTARAAALDAGLAIPVEQAAAAVRAGGRVAGPDSLPVPPGVREIARDATGWVGEREASASPPIALESRRLAPRR